MTTLVPLTSPDALFAPPSALSSPVPAPLYLFEFVPGTLAHFYATNPDGTVRDREDYFHERTITYATGVAVTVRAVASPRHGLPMQHDTDIMLGLLRLADQGGVSTDGTVIDPSYRAILRAAGRTSARSSDDVTAIKRALARWTVTVETEAVVDFQQLGAALHLKATALPFPPSIPERSTRTSAYPVLEYSYDAESRQTGTVDTIDHLNINPVWLSQAHAGIASWIDVDIHNSLRSSWAKRIYQHLASRAALGWQPDELLTLPLSDFLQALAVRSGRRPAEDAESIRKALHILQSCGVVRHYIVRQLRKGTHAVAIDGGEYLIGASRLRGLTTHDTDTTRMLLAHLKSYGVSERDAREFVAKQPGPVLSALRYLHYRSLNQADKPIKHPAQWLRRALADGYLFEEPGYRQWVTTHSSKVLPRSNRTQHLQPVPIHEPSVPLHLPDNLWGHLLADLVARQAISEATARMFFADSSASPPTASGSITITLPDAFAIQWVESHYRDLLERSLSAVHNCPISIVFAG